MKIQKRIPVPNVKTYKVARIEIFTDFGSQSTDYFVRLLDGNDKAIHLQKVESLSAGIDFAASLRNLKEPLE